MTVSKLLEELSLEEFVNWIAFYRIKEKREKRRRNKQGIRDITRSQLQGKK